MKRLSRCLICNSEFENNIRGTRKTCSQKCIKAQHKLVQRNNKNNLKPVRKCAECNKEYTKTAGMKKATIFCSAECSKKGKIKKGKEKHNLQKEIKICVQCNSNFTGRGKVCSRNCRKDHNKYIPKVKNCKTCNKKFLSRKDCCDSCIELKSQEKLKHKIRICYECNKEHTRSSDTCSKECAIAKNKNKKITVCDVCSTEFIARFRTACCSDECRIEHKRIYKIKEKEKLLQKNLEEFKDIDLPYCRICGFKAHALTIHVNAAHKMKVPEYKEKFNLTTEDVFSKEYLKTLSENVSGEKNVWYNHGGRLSPFSTKFVAYQHLSEEEKSAKTQEMFKIASDNRDANGGNTTRIDYYLKQGLTQEEAEAALKNRQTTFSLEKCIAKYGEEEGLKKWNARQEQWQNTLKAKPIEEIERINQAKVWKSGSSSIISQQLFEKINIPGCRYGEKTKTNLGEKYESYVDEDGNIKGMMLDFTFNNKVIEFLGTYWHADPRKYTDDSAIFKRRNGYVTAKTVWENDAKRKATLEDKGYEVLFVWEEDFRKNPEKVINDCKKFLYKTKAEDSGLVPNKKTGTDR